MKCLKAKNIQYTINNIIIPYKYNNTINKLNNLKEPNSGRSKTVSNIQVKNKNGILYAVIQIGEKNNGRVRGGGYEIILLKRWFSSNSWDGSRFALITEFQY